MRTRSNRAVTALLVLVASAAITAAQPAPSVSDGWVAVPAVGATTAVVSASIQNPTMYDIYVVSASSDVAGKVEFRERQGGDSQAVKDLTVASFGSLDLKADGPHLVLVDLKRPLKEGETVEITLKTDGGLSLKLAAVVKREK